MRTYGLVSSAYHRLRSLWDEPRRVEATVWFAYQLFCNMMFLRDGTALPLTVGREAPHVRLQLHAKAGR